MLEQFNLWNCATCHLAFDGLDRIIDSDLFANSAIALVQGVCNMSGMVPHEVCHDFVHTFEPVLGSCLKTSLFGKSTWCNKKLGLCDHVHITEIDVHDVVDNILATKPVHLANDNFIDNLYEEVAADPDQESRNKIKAVHISDVHLDLEYEAGTLASCDSYLCCRAESYTAGDVNVKAGEWGSNYGLCDIPTKTFESMMNYIV